MCVSASEMDRSAHTVGNLACGEKPRARLHISQCNRVIATLQTILDLMLQEEQKKQEKEECCYRERVPGTEGQFTTENNGIWV